MAGNYTQLYVHCVWATWDRLPLIDAECEKEVYASIIDKCRSLNCEVLAIGGIEDHVHLLVQLPATLALSTLIGEVKGESSHLMTRVIRAGIFFRWQGSYGAFTVSYSGLPEVTRYIKNQKQHHKANTLIGQWERFSEIATPKQP